MADCKAPNRCSVHSAVAAPQPRQSPSNVFVFAEPDHIVATRSGSAKGWRLASLPIHGNTPAADLSEVPGQLGQAPSIVLSDLHASQHLAGASGYLQHCRLTFGSTPAHFFRFLAVGPSTSIGRTQQVLILSPRAPEQHMCRAA